MIDTTIGNSRQYILSVLFLLAASVLRFYHLEDQSLWNDEMFTLDVASHTLGDIQPFLIAHYHHPPLYFYLAHFAIGLFGYSAWAIRSVSALSGALTVGMVFLFTSEMFSVRSGVVAATVCLLAPFYLAYSQEGRPYALASLLCLASLWSLWWLWQTKSRLSIVVYTITSVALLYTHHWGMFVIASHVVIVAAILPGGWKEKSGIVLAWILTLVSYLPEIFAIHRQMSTSAPDGWFWVEPPTIATLVHVITAYSGTYFKMASSIFSLPLQLRILGVASMLIIGVIAAILTKSRESVSLRMMLLNVTGILTIPLLVALYKPEVFVWWRFTVIAFPTWCVVLGRVVAGDKEDWKSSLSVGQFSRAKRIMALIAGASLLLMAALGTFQYFSWHKSNVKDIAAYVDSLERADKIGMIIRPKSFSPLLNYYYHGRAIQFNEAYLNTSLGDVVDTASSFIYISLDVSNEIRSYMGAHFDAIAQRHFPGEAHMGIIVGAYRQKGEEQD